MLKPALSDETDRRDNLSQVFVLFCFVFLLFCFVLFFCCFVLFCFFVVLFCFAFSHAVTSVDSLLISGKIFSDLLFMSSERIFT